MMRSITARSVLLLALGGFPLMAPALQNEERDARRREKATLSVAWNDETPRVDAGRVEDGASRASGALVYQPPRRGAPRERTAGGLRANRALPTLLALTPEHLAQTASEQPSLFWHIDAAAPEGAQVVFTLIDDTHVEPLVEMELPAPRAAGLQRVRLADCGLTLELEVEYEWSVALVTDPANRSRDVVATGYMRRVEWPAALDSGTPTSARAYAALGLWYDALESLGDILQASPGNAQLVEQRNSLLRQAGLELAVE
jgi:hypothetical protein